MPAHQAVARALSTFVNDIDALVATPNPVPIGQHSRPTLSTHSPEMLTGYFALTSRPIIVILPKAHTQIPRPSESQGGPNVRVGQAPCSRPTTSSTNTSRRCLTPPAAPRTPIHTPTNPSSMTWSHHGELTGGNQTLPGLDQPLGNKPAAPTAARPPVTQQHPLPEPQKRRPPNPRVSTTRGTLPVVALQELETSPIPLPTTKRISRRNSLISTAANTMPTYSPRQFIISCTKASSPHADRNVPDIPWSATTPKNPRVTFRPVTSPVPTLSPATTYDTRRGPQHGT
jgi:hypothetical protein